MGRFRLIGCPAGFQTQNTSHDTQRCHPCLESQYIIDPDTDTCQRCPPGLVCNGNNWVVPIVENSTWEAQDGVYKLTSCPTGFRKISTEGEWDQHKCEPCADGTECVLDVCDTCTVCTAGKYKDTPGTQACRACPPNTYNPDINSKALANCQACPSGSETGGLDGQTEASACQCGDRLYLKNPAGSGGIFSCANCPRGAVCADGSCALRNADFNCSDGTSIVGDWVINNSTGSYDLRSCPAGYETWTTQEQGSEEMQQCHKCLESQYIIDPDLYACQKCPPGLKCKGDSEVVPVVKKSTWTADDGVYKLTACPTGYRKLSTEGGWDQHKCEPCADGTECVLDVCDTCTACTAGKYKDAPGTQACRACPPNTYNPDINSKALANCQACPSGSETGGLDGQTEASACQCGDRLYLKNPAGSGGIFSCANCPRGAVCADGSCALRNADFNCSDGTSIVGDWVINNSTGSYDLRSCPAGYETWTTQEQGSEEMQQCHKCLESQYIIDPDLYACQKCPPGLKCKGDSEVVPVVKKSTWTADDGVYKLTACPTGYRKLSTEGGWDQHKCEPCADGTECVLDVCDTCTACTAGKYKDAPGTQACRACPRNTYNPDTNSKALSSCRSCPAGADTGGRDGQTDPDSCTCGYLYYMIESVDAHVTTSTCSPCPIGGICMESGIEKGRCAFNLVNESRRCSIKGDWQRSPIDGRVQVLNCPAGNLVVNTSGHDFQTCEQCAQGKYTVDPFSGACHVCPASATCWNGAPPIFGASKVAGSIDIDLPEDSEEPVIRKALASKFGVKEWQISLLARARRTARKISFQLVASKEGMSSVEARFDAYGVVREYKHNLGEPIAAGEKWEELGGMFLLRSCPPGHQLINTTNDGALDVDGQRCSKCQPNTYIVDQMRPCVKCPKGATCLDGVQFVSNAPGSEWEMERADNGGLQRRIASCPVGYKMQREHRIPDADDCIR